MNQEEMGRLERKRMLEELRRNGKRGSFIVEDDDHDSNDERRFEVIAGEFEKIDDQMRSEMKDGAISMLSMEIERDEVSVDDDGDVFFETGEKEIDVEVIDMRFDEGLRDFLKDDVKADLFGDAEDIREGDIDRLTQCPRCGSNDVQIIAPPNMYCNACDETYSYDMGMDEIQNIFGVEFKDEEKKVITPDQTDGKKIRRIIRPDEV